MRKTKHLFALLIVVAMVFTFSCTLLVACNKTLTITFDANGGKFGTEDSVTATAEKSGVVLEAPVNPTREGYTFTGYTTNKAGTGDAITFGENGTQFTESTRVYAQWKIASTVNPGPTPGGDDVGKDKIFTITIDANGGEFEEGATEVTQKTGKDGKLESIPSPTREGFVCIGFTTEQDSSGDNVDTDYVFSEDTTIYAQWMDESEMISVKVTLNVGEGTLPEGAKTEFETEFGLLTEELPIPESNKAHFQFVGWFTKQSGGSLVDEDTVFTEDTTIYARYLRDDGVWVNGDFGAEFPLNTGAETTEYWLGSEDTKISLTEGDRVEFYVNGKLCTDLWITGTGVKTQVDPKPSYVTVTRTAEFMIFLKDYSGGAGTDYVVEFRTSTEAGNGSEEDIPVGAAPIVITIGSFKPITIYLAKSNGTGVPQAELKNYCIYTFSDEIFGNWATSATKGVCASTMTVTVPSTVTKVPKGWIFRWGSGFNSQTSNIEDAIKEGGTYVVQLPAATQGDATVTEIVTGA